MATVQDIIDAFGGPAEFGRICGFTEHPGQRGADMKRRGSIPVTYWKRLAEVAAEKGLGVTYDTLVEAHSSQPVAAAE